MKLIRCIVLLNLLCLSNTYANVSYQGHNEIIATVQAFLDKNLTSTEGVDIKTQIGRPDKRLKLTACKEPLKASSNNNARFTSKVSVMVKCEGVKPWSLYLQVKIQRFTSIFISSRPIAKGDQITEKDIQYVSQDVSHLRGSYYKSKQDILGKIAKRSIKLGSTFNPRYLRQAILVKKGDAVDIVAEMRGLQIRMSGKAISAGAKGEKINVKNLSSKRTIQAIVEHPGLVKVMM